MLVEAVNINGNKGSSTAVMLTFDIEKDHTILTTNLGDSAYIQFRPSQDGSLKQIYKSKE
jgi:hypothetical protein